MLPNELFAVGDGDSDYDIPKSLRFRGSNLAQLSRAFATPTNDKIWTFSAWVKRGSLGSRDTIFNGGGSNCNYICFNDNGTEYFGLTYANSGATVNVMSNAVFRDVSNHYHLMVAYDSTQAVASERVRLYVNGVRLTSLSVATYPSQNTACYINSDGQTAYIGSRGIGDAISYLEGYVSEVNFVDGQALTPSYFGQWSQVSGQWIPIKYTGTYGNNGFYLDFKDATSLTTLGYDKSGLNNHWTVNNASLTAGVNYDSTLDTPTNNFAVLNQNDKNANGTINIANLGITAGSQWIRTKATIGVKSGKWYWETQHTVYNQSYQGICDDTFQMGTNSFLGGASGWSAAYNEVGDLWINGVNTASWGATLALGDIVGWALDMDNGTLQAYKNGVLVGTVVSSLNAKGTIYPAFSLANSAVLNVNFGQRPFAYTPPSGFNSLCSANLPAPTIKRGEAGFDVATYTGNGGNLQVGESQFPRPNYLIGKSLRFRGVNSSLSRTPGVVGNRTTWTFSTWIKNTDFSISNRKCIFATNSSTNRFAIFLNYSNNSLDIHGNGQALRSTSLQLKSSDWVHLLVSLDTTNSNINNRLIISLNGKIVSSFNGNISISQNTLFDVNLAAAHSLGFDISESTRYLNGYLAEVNFIDGQALGPENFGEFDINGYWIPKAYAGTYGQNGFYLDFSDTAAVANLGYDKSGRGNNWTPNNISLTAGINYDSMLDSPTNNFAILNTLLRRTSVASEVFSDAGLTVSNPGSLSDYAISTLLPNGGKWYWEVYIATIGAAANTTMMGIDDGSTLIGGSSALVAYLGDGGITYQGNIIANVAAYTTGDTISIALDNSDNGSVKFYKNNVLQYTSSIPKATNLGALIACGRSPGVSNVNFGQRPFAYTPPEGFKTLSIPNIAEYSYDLESPDLVWIKCRNAAQNHMLFDSVRGVGKYLSSNLTANEATDVNSLISFNKNGFYLGNNANVNTLNNSYVAWMWKANQTQVANNNGSITSQVRANPDIGFSIVKYTGNLTAAQTVGHGIGIQPKFIIVKKLIGGAASANWRVWHANLSGNSYFLGLNQTEAQANSSSVFNGVNSLTFTIGADPAINESGKEHIAYCFTEIEGFSKFGSYTGNGLGDGTFVYCGFKPRFILGKRIDAAEDWFILTPDVGANGSYNFLRANGTTIEAIMAVDILSNGFKMRGAGAPNNTSGGTYIFAAFAECPVKYSNAR